MAAAPIIGDAAAGLAVHATARPRAPPVDVELVEKNDNQDFIPVPHLDEQEAADLANLQAQANSAVQLALALNQHLQQNDDLIALADNQVSLSDNDVVPTSDSSVNMQSQEVSEGSTVDVDLVLGLPAQTPANAPEAALPANAQPTRADATITLSCLTLTDFGPSISTCKGALVHEKHLHRLQEKKRLLNSSAVKIVEEQGVRRSLRVRTSNRSFKKNSCSEKNCLACAVDPPTLSDSVIRNLGISFCELEPQQVADTVLKTKTKAAKKAVGKTPKDKKVSSKKTINPEVVVPFAPKPKLKKPGVAKKKKTHNSDDDRA
ncbi:hypothetical protein C2845_PM06G27630 [Panicum miliaceum]|uniref:Uncharacterized protein n=1 Tax=Panicum miliaceum TaxID=4540 RepID=A0A3L6RC78_PANMI|nr:hypothetical protein C2845_PM06G27630 [Panicum miliaceum]